MRREDIHMKKCAVYTRVSVTPQAGGDFDSCEAQKAKILSYIASQQDMELFREYSDAGFTGANLERPALNELIRDIGLKKVDLVLAYKIDRLTRSSKDFYNLIDVFEAHGASFVSVTERFDTSSPSGRLLRNIMLTFAQFERELTAERTRDKLQQRAQNGLWNGGVCPFGYRRKNGRLLADESAARWVRRIFEWFIETGSSRAAYRNCLKHEARNPRTGRIVTFSTVGHILRNPVYAGRIRWGNELHAGRHVPLISAEIFEKAQRLVRQRRDDRKPGRVFLLAGSLVKCASCGTTMSPYGVRSKNRRFHYYKCQSVMKNGAAACRTKAPSAEPLEKYVIQNLLRTADDVQFIENLAFRETARRSDGRMGLETLEACSKLYEAHIHRTFQTLKERLSSTLMIDQATTIRRFIQKITYYAESIEVAVKIEDTNSCISIRWPFPQATKPTSPKGT